MTDVRVYPHSKEIERAVLGTLLLDPDRLGEVRLEAVDFYDPYHGQIFGLMQSLVADGASCDLASVVLAAQRIGLDKFGGYEALAGLVDHASFAVYETHWRQIRGDAARRRMLQALQRAEGQLYGGLDTADSVLRQLDEDLNLAAAGDSSRGSAVFIGDVMAGIHADLLSPPDVVSRFSTGFNVLDRELGGFADGKLWVLAAGTGAGKTSLALELAFRCADRGDGVLVFSTEMSKREIGARLLSSQGGISEGVIHADGVLPSVVSDVGSIASDLAGMDLAVVDQAGITPGEIARHCRRVAARMKASGGRLRLIVVDYLQRLGLEEGRGVNRSRAVGAGAQSMKNLAMDLGCSVLLLSQFSRAAQDMEVPQLRHLRDSGEIEQEADAVLFLQRVEALSTVKVHVAKNRHGRSGHWVPIGWRPGHARAWSDPSPEVEKQLRHMIAKD